MFEWKSLYPNSHQGCLALYSPPPHIQSAFCLSHSLLSVSLSAVHLSLCLLSICLYVCCPSVSLSACPSGSLSDVRLSHVGRVISIAESDQRLLAVCPMTAYLSISLT
ncbi:unnamed protein product [Gadus morhua 'NCC']